MLAALSVAPDLRLSELGRRVGVAKSTAHRTCSVLAESGLLTRTESGRYRLGLKLIEYGHLAAARSSVGEHALPLLVELRALLGETASSESKGCGPCGTPPTTRVAGRCTDRALARFWPHSFPV